MPTTIEGWRAVARDLMRPIWPKNLVEKPYKVHIFNNQLCKNCQFARLNQAQFGFCWCGYQKWEEK